MSLIHDKVSIAGLAKELQKLLPDSLLSMGVAPDVVPAHHQLAGLGEECVVGCGGRWRERKVDQVTKAGVPQDLVVGLSGLAHQLLAIVHLRKIKN